MTTRKFYHDFTPASSGTGGQAEILLTTTEIAGAAIFEIAQMSLSTVPFDLFLDQLLVPGDQWFRWTGPLGQIRETKTALSGLFGRFVARAYLTRYLGFSHFEPIRSDTQLLNGWPNLSVKRTKTGDLPDWVIASTVGANTVAIAEAKGSHNTAGAAAPLDAAKSQVRRVNIVAGSTVLKVKRYAIATRWAVKNAAGLDAPWLVVHDPEDGDREPNRDEQGLLVRSIALGHFASIAEGFGLRETAVALRSAKSKRPGHLQLSQREVLAVSRSGEENSTGITAIVTPAGLIAIPRTGDLEEFRSALLTVYGERTLVLTISAATLYAADQIPDLAKESVPARAADAEHLWTQQRRYPDGSVLIPLKMAAMERIPPDQSIVT